MSVIELSNVSKSYRLGATRTSLREAIVSSARSAVRGKNTDDDKLFWALRDVSYSVNEGEVLGIIGHNGAGKSTMLKLLSRVTYPTTGHIRTRGRMASLIELGAGFHPDLSGRDNIYLNGSILGLKRHEIDSQLDSIVSFAGLEQFLDTPVKRYSSGMYVRLAFAVAAHVKADLLLVDEVLSVGDLGFQDKSLKKMTELRDNGATVVFISHNMNAVSMFCSRVLLMDHGRLVESGSPAQVISSFEELQKQMYIRESMNNAAPIKISANGNSSNGHDLAPDALDGTAATGRTPFITDVRLVDDDGNPVTEVTEDSGLCVRWRIVVPDDLFKPVSGIRVCNAADGYVCFNEWQFDRRHINLHGEVEVEVRIPSHYLRANDYYVEALLAQGGEKVIVAFSQRVPLRVLGDQVEGHGVYRPTIEWCFDSTLIQGSSSQLLNLD